MRAVRESVEPFAEHRASRAFERGTVLRGGFAQCGGGRAASGEIAGVSDEPVLEAIRENFGVFDFTLDQDDLAAIAKLDRGERLGPDPLKFP